MKYLITEAPATINCGYVCQYRLDSRKNPDTDDRSREDYWQWVAVADIVCGSSGVVTVAISQYSSDQFTAIRVLGLVNEFLVDDSKSFLNIAKGLRQQDNA